MGDELRWESGLPAITLGVKPGDVLTIRSIDGSVDHLLVMDVHTDGHAETWDVLSGNAVESED